ncbi:MAG TPA: adenylate/guanylate cyclase domain-containing protein [Puia sp.]|nr:adenylate/guanylate cyclase domain-containing protein [Puia sp.]
MAQTRQLAAIMFTDIVGYTSLMGEDEKKAFDLLRKNRELQKPLVSQFNGKWIKELGDGVLASFQTVTDAVACAMKIQLACSAIIDLKLRIGIHLGEVVFEDNDVFGDGVNIASRLQALAPVGGIYISESVFRNIANQKDMETEFVKEEVLKNVKHPVKIYQLKKHDLYTRLTYGSKIADKKIPDRKPVEKSIAVLPFINMSNDPEQEYFSDGISEEIINSLVQLPQLRVVGRTSAFSFKGKNDDLRTVGEKLGVTNILEGSVRKAGNRIRITAQLIEVSNGFHVWSQKFDRELIDIFDVQDEISKAIVDQLTAEFTKLENPAVAKSTTKNVEAYNLFLKGRFYWSKRTEDGLKKSIQFYEETISMDPNYAAAYAAISDSYSLLCAYHILAPQDSILKAREIAKKAVAIDEFLAEGYEAMGHVELLYDWNWNSARQSYEQAIKLNPSYATALQRHALLAALFDKHEEALEEIMTAVHYEPLSLIINTDVAIIYFIQRNYDAAINKCLGVFEIDSNFGVALFVIGLCYEQLGQFDEAINYFQKAWNLSGNHIALGALIHAFGKSGKKEDALNLLNKLKNAAENIYISPYTFACAYLGLGELETALEFMEKAVETHSVWLIHLHMKSDPRMDPLREELRFQYLLAQMGLH